MKRQHEWTQQERETAQKMHASGLSWKEVGEELGRSKSAVISAIHRYEGREWTTRSVDYFDGPPIGRTLECQRIEKDAKLGSTVLGEAIRELLGRMSDRKVAEVLGAAERPSVPGRKPVLRGQLAERRLAAAA